MNVLEVAIYAMVLSAQHPQPFQCFAVRPAGVNCTNGLAATPGADGAIVFSDGVSVVKGRGGQVTFTDGTTTGYDAMAWVTFRKPDGAPIVSARRVAPLRFKFSNGIHCETTSSDPERARCWRP